MSFVGSEQREFRRVSLPLVAVLEGSNGVVDTLVENISLRACVQGSSTKTDVG